MRMVHGVLVLLGLLAAACDSDSSGSGGAGGTDPGTGGSGGGGAKECPTTADPSVTDVSGRWASLGVGSQLIYVPGFEDPFPSRIVSVLLVEQTQTGENISMTGEYCDHHTEDPDSQIHVIVPNAYRDALEPISRTGTFGAGASYQLSPLHEVVGATLADLETDELPVSPDDPRVIDQDMDGDPGMTLHLTGLVDGEVHVVERKTTAPSGVAISSDRIEGRGLFMSERSILATDPSSIYGTATATQWLADPEECNSYFRMVRVPDNADCAWVNDNLATLFP